jgi:regulator of cell morphogenesis and NO signaling
MLLVMEENMNFSSETKVKDIALSSPAARQVLENAGVDYCCGGGKSVHEACLQANVPAEEILKRLHENSKGAGPEEITWSSKPLAELTQHIHERHHRYVRETIARVRPLLEKVKTRHGENHCEIAAIEGLFLEVSQEMIMHMQKEEQILFPYIDAIERSANGNVSLERPFFQTVQNPIHAMMKDHDSAGDLVKQIRKASSQYTAPADACASYKALYQELHDFEADLHQHVHLENNILFPRAAEMEAAVVQRG